MSKGSKNIFRGRIRGIGLMELCVFIVSAGLIVMAGVPLFEVYETHKHMDVTNASVEQTQVALDAYYQKNGFFPCPAPFVKVDGPNFGMADKEICTSPISIGAVPTRTLGLPDSAGIDGWNHLLTYAITHSYTKQGAAPTDMMSGKIYITDSHKNTATASPGIAVYVVVPANPDGAGAYGLNGKKQSPCPSGTSIEARICNADGTTKAKAFLSTTLQGSEGNRFVSNAIAMRADTCATGTPTAGDCGTNATTKGGVPYPFGSTLPSGHGAYCAGAGSSMSPLNSLRKAPPAGSPEWSWTCNGSCQAQNANCWTDLCVKIDAECGSANGKAFTSPPADPELCKNGISPRVASGAAGSPPTYNWICAGDCDAHHPQPDCNLNPRCIGTNASCSAKCVPDGKCTQATVACGNKQTTCTDNCGETFNQQGCHFCAGWYSGGVLVSNVSFSINNACYNVSECHCSGENWCEPNMGGTNGVKPLGGVSYWWPGSGGTGPTDCGPTKTQETCVTRPATAAEEPNGPCLSPP